MTTATTDEITAKLTAMTMAQLRGLAHQAEMTKIPTKKADLVAVLAAKAQQATTTKPTRIDHSECDHPRTWAGRQACRTARRAS